MRSIRDGVGVGAEQAPAPMPAQKEGLAPGVKGSEVDPEEVATGGRCWK